MKFKLELLEYNMGKDLYDMYQDIPKEELGSYNKFFGCPINTFNDELIKTKENEKVIEDNLNTTTNRYILFVDDYPVGEFGIRTTLNDFWINKGSQVFYKIRKILRTENEKSEKKITIHKNVC